MFQFIFFLKIMNTITDVIPFEASYEHFLLRF